MLEYTQEKKGDVQAPLPLGKSWLEKPRVGSLLSKLLPDEK